MFYQFIDEAKFSQHFGSRCRGMGNYPIRDGAELYEVEDGVVRWISRRKSNDI